MESHTFGELMCSAVHTFASRLRTGTETCIVNIGCESIVKHSFDIALYLQIHGYGYLVSESVC